MKKLFMDKHTLRLVVGIEMEIDKHLEQMKDIEDVEKKEIAVNSLDSLINARNDLLNDGKVVKSLDWVSLLNSAVGLYGIKMMLKFEQNDIVTTKTVGSVLKWIGK